MAFDRDVMRVVKPELEAIWEAFQDRDGTTDLKPITDAINAKAAMIKSEVAVVESIVHQIATSQVDSDQSEEANDELASEEEKGGLLRLVMQAIEEAKPLTPDEQRRYAEQLQREINQSLKRKVLTFGTAAGTAAIVAGSITKDLIAKAITAVQNARARTAIDRLGKQFNELRSSIRQQLQDDMARVAAIEGVNQDNYRTIYEKLSECCENMGSAMERVEGKINQLQPGAQSSSMLELVTLSKTNLALTSKLGRYL